MRIDAIRHPFQLTPRPGRATTATAPVDTVTLSKAPSSGGRSWLWSALAASGALTAQIVQGPIGTRLSVEQTLGLQEMLRELQSKGGTLQSDNNLLGLLLTLGKERREVQPDEAVKLLLAGERLWVHPPGQAQPTRVETLDSLAAVDALVLGAPAQATSAPHRVQTLKNLTQAGYQFPDGLVQAYHDRYVNVVKPSGEKPGLSHAALGAEDYFQVSHDRNALEHPELAEALEANRDAFQEPLASVYAGAHDRHWGAELKLQGLVITELDEPTAAEAVLAAQRMRTGERILQQVFPGRASYDAGRIVRAVVHRDGGTDPVATAEVLDRIHRADPNHAHRCDVDDLYAGELKRGHRGAELLGRLELMAGLVHATGMGDVVASTDYLQGRGAIPQYAALARVTGGEKARALLTRAELVEQPDLDMLVRLASAQALTGKEVNSELLARDFRLLSEPGGGAAVRQAFEQGLQDGHHALTPLRALATLRQVSPEELERLSRLVEEPRVDLPAILTGKMSGESAEQAYARYQSLSQSEAGPEVTARVFPWLGPHREELMQLVVSMGRLKRSSDAGEVFLRLKKLAGDDLEPAVEEFVRNLLLTNDVEQALNGVGHTQNGAAIAVHEDIVRIGGASLKVRQKSVLN